MTIKFIARRWKVLCWRFARLAPRLAGETARDRMIAAAGAIAGIGLTAILSAWAINHSAYPLLIVAPIGASSVLLFAVPASPLAQPWPIIGGNVISALVGMTVGGFVHDPLPAFAFAAGGAIAAMSLLRCLHPPGGAVAPMSAALAQTAAGPNYWFALNPVGLNSVLLVLSGWLFHRFTRHSYPHVPLPTVTSPDPPTPPQNLYSPEDVDAALADLAESFDIGREDIDRLLQQIEIRAAMRAKAEGRSSSGKRA
jgi:CBS domain-containing membrane protein